MADSLSPSKACQLYSMVAVPAFTYASDVWYAPSFKLTHSSISIGTTKLFHPIQGCIAQSTKPLHHLLDHIHATAEKLQQKQDKIQNATEFRNTRCMGGPLITCTKGVFNLWIQWVPGHKDFMPNTKADEHAKRVAKGDSS